MIYLNLILLSVILYGLNYISNMKKESVVKSLKKDHHVVKKRKGYPNWSDADPNFQVLKDVVKSVELEQWNVTIEKRSIITDSYEVIFTNPSSTLALRTLLSVHDDQPTISRTQVRVYSDNVNYNSVMVDDSDYAAELVLNLVWDAIIRHYDDLWSQRITDLNNSMETIKKRLKTLNRDRQLDKLI